MKKGFLLSIAVMFLFSGCVSGIPPLPILHGKQLRAIFPSKHYKPRFHTRFSDTKSKLNKPKRIP